ncbi:MAG TPA: hypothetical protein V6D09_17070 [Leptolyngbyaceae cyanobacterium]
MISALFQPEISNLESQIAQLQTQIALHQERITHLNEAESVADNAVASLQSALEKVSSVSPAAIESLKVAVLGLFRGGDTPGGGNDGDNPPGGDGGSSPNEPKPEPNLNEQDTEVSDTLTEVENSYVRLVQLSETAAYMAKFDGEILAAYLGLNSKSKSQAWGAWCVQNGIASGYELRASKRLTTKYEIKLWDVSFKEIERLSKLDLTQYPPKAILELVAKPDETEQPLVQAELEQHLEEQAAAIAPEHPLIDPLDVPEGCILERSEDWLNLEYFVRAHVIVRVKGVPTPQIKTLGRLIETGKGICAYANFSSIARYFPDNESAIRYLAGVASTSLNQIAEAFEQHEHLMKKRVARL